MKNVSFPDLIIFDYNQTLARDDDQKLYSGVSGVIEDAHKTLLYLKVRGINLGLVSNNFNYIFVPQVKVLQLDHYFDLIWGAGSCYADDHAVYRKPSATLGRKFIEAWMHQMNCQKSLKDLQVWMIGDAATDVEFARNSGFTAIGFQNAYAREHNFNNFDNYADFIQWFEQKFPQSKG